MSRTAKQIRAEFESRGLSIAEWARLKGYPVNLVYQILSGKRSAKRGASHRIAVELGLKQGRLEGYEALPFQIHRGGEQK